MKTFFFSYNETSNGLTLTNDDILNDENGKVSEKYFDFNVKLKTQYEKSVDYYIYLTKEEGTLDESYIKLYLTDQNDTLLNDVTTISSLQEHDEYTSSKYLYENSITSNNNIETTHNYRLRVWVSDSYSNIYNTSEEESGLHQTTQEEGTYQFTVNVATGKIPSNLASYWTNTGFIYDNYASYLALYTLDTKNLPETYEYNNTIYTLEKTKDVSEQENNSVMFGQYINGSNMIAVIGQDGGVVAPANSYGLFTQRNVLYNLIVLELKVLDLTFLDTTNVTNMNAMFYGCENLINLDLTSFDTSKVTDMSSMFFYCSSLTSIIVGCNFVINESTATTNMFVGAGVSEVTKVCNE